MKVFDDLTHDLGDGHLIEIGEATWDKTRKSIRNRYPTRKGGFSPRSSSEIPIEDVVHIALQTIKNGFMSAEDKITLLRALLKDLQTKVLYTN